MARPSDWAWTTTIASGQPCYSTYNSGGKAYIAVITAVEWNDFTTRINDFRVYKELSTYSFTTASSGGAFYASIINEARTAINDMSPPTSVPGPASSGGIVTAYILNRLKDALNSIT